MSTDLVMLAWSAVLTLVLTFPPLFALISSRGLAYAAGNRPGPLELPPWGERAVKAQRNLLDNFVPFAALVLTAHVAGVANEATAFGASLFFGARVAHAVIYIAGIPYLRTVAFVVSLSGLFEILGELLGAGLLGG